MTRTKLFFDVAFTGFHQNTTLISIGIMSEAGVSFYCELEDYDKSQIDDWLNENVIKNLMFKPAKSGGNTIQFFFADSKNNRTVEKSVRMRGTKSDLERELRSWLSQFNKVEFWGDCLSYDWVLFCQIFGHAFKIPENIYYIPFDICTLFKDKGLDPDINRVSFANQTEGVILHNSLDDAFVIKKCYQKLMSIK